jgi:hypothetical protein
MLHGILGFSILSVILILHGLGAYTWHFGRKTTKITTTYFKVKNTHRTLAKVVYFLSKISIFTGSMSVENLVAVYLVYQTSVWMIMALLYKRKWSKSKSFS